jgi:hypothetical protein
VFRKLDLFPSSGEGRGKTPTLLGPLETANLNHNHNFVMKMMNLTLAIYKRIFIENLERHNKLGSLMVVESVNLG